VVATLAAGVPPESGAGRCGGGALRLFLWRRARTEEWVEEDTPVLSDCKSRAQIVN